MIRPSGFRESFSGSTRNGVTSQASRFSFPSTFQLSEVNSSFCGEIYWYFLVVAFIGFMMFLLLQPSDICLFFALMIVLYWYVYSGLNK